MAGSADILSALSERAWGIDSDGGCIEQAALAHLAERTPEPTGCRRSHVRSRPETTRRA